MKKTVALLLTALLILGLFVSCNEEPKKPVADEETVETAAIDTAMWFLVLSNQIERLASGEDPQKIEEELSTRLSRVSGQVEADSKNLSVSLSRKDQSISARFYNIMLSSETGEVSGFYILSETFDEEDEITNLTVMSKFTFDEEDYSIICFNVTIDGVSYDVDAFNEALNAGIPVYG